MALADGVPCKHTGCASHISHACEGCGRIGARTSGGNQLTNDQIYEKVKLEIARGELKHGSWKDMPKTEQLADMCEELTEWADAVAAKDVHGEHGEIAEAIQVIGVFFRRIRFLTGDER